MVLVGRSGHDRRSGIIFWSFAINPDAERRSATTFPDAGMPNAVWLLPAFVKHFRM